MRIKITLEAFKNGIIDFNYQHQIQAIIYAFLARSDPDYALWLHKDGYVYKKDKRFKLFVYSGIIFHGPISLNSLNCLNGLNGLNDLNSLNGFHFNASQSSHFTLSFQIASPVNQFIQHLVNGIFKEGVEITLGRQRLNVHRVETLEIGLNGLNNLLLKPLESPIFVKKPMPIGQRDVYLFPDDERYEGLLNQNLFHKYETLYGKSYEGESLKFNFRLKPSKIIKSFKIFKNGKPTGEIKGTLQPFTVSGPKELITIGLECGFGQNNSMGCGYVTV